MTLFSIIIPTYNRSALLKQTLESVLRQSYPQEQFEVLVIDNGSTDDTNKVVELYSGKNKNIKYFHQEKPGLHEGRHTGLRESTGEFLVYIDDDIIAPPNWLEGIHESFLDARVGLVGGKDLPIYESDPPNWIESLWVYTPAGKYITYYSLIDLGDSVKPIDPHFVFGCNFSIRKALLQKIKGFHPDGMPQSLLKYRGDGETYVAQQVQKMGYTTIYNPKASINHWVPSSRMNIEYIKKRAFLEGITSSFIDTRKKVLYNQKTNPLFTLGKVIKRNIAQLFLSDLKTEIIKSFRKGYKFHQAELKKDKDLLSWVLKDNYLE